jgi:superfamily I DNA/RNA helicase
MKKEKIILTQEQTNCVQFQDKGELLVKGVPGAGKTTVLIERAIYLREQDKKNDTHSQIIMLTYNNALSTYIAQLARESVETPIEAKTFHGWAGDLLRKSGINKRIVDKQKHLDVMKFAMNIIAKFEPNTTFPNIDNFRSKLTFFIEEISWMKQNEISNFGQYEKITRAGRGNKVQILKAHRETIFKVFEKYNELLEREKLIDFDDVAILVYRNIDRFSANEKAHHILIDEAQDLSAAQFRAIKLMTMKSLTIAADKGQQIYRRNFSWSSLDINVSGARSKSLNMSFRSTKQIVQWARCLQNKDASLLKDPDFVNSGDPKAQGTLPELYKVADTNAEMTTILKKVVQLQKSFPQDTIGIIATKWEDLSIIGEHLAKLHIPSIHVKQDSAEFITPGVRLITYYSAKGLEFDHVIVTQLQDKKMPMRPVDPGDDDAAFHSRERKKLYVAMTRARLTLTLVAIVPYSPFVAELEENKDLYKQIESIS